MFVLKIALPKIRILARKGLAKELCFSKKVALF